MGGRLPALLELGRRQERKLLMFCFMLVTNCYRSSIREMNAVVPVVTVKLLVCVLQSVSTLMSRSLVPSSLT